VSEIDNLISELQRIIAGSSMMHHRDTVADVTILANADVDVLGAAITTIRVQRHEIQKLRSELPSSTRTSQGENHEQEARRPTR
jgi:hypothetical protein